MKLVEFKYVNLDNNDVVFGFEDFVNNNEVMWDEEGRMWINENDVEKMNEVYKLYVLMVESGDCWDGMDEDEYEYEMEGVK